MLDPGGATHSSLRAGPAHSSQNVLANKPADWPITVPLVINGFPPGLPVTHSAPAPPTQQAVATGCPPRALLSTCMPLTPWHLLQSEESCFRLPAPPPCFLSASCTGLFPPTSPDSRPFGTAFNAGIWVFFTCSREHSVHIGVALLHPDPIRSSHSHQPATPYG